MLARCLLLALNFPLLGVRPYWLATILIAIANIALVATWDRPDRSPEGSRQVGRRPRRARLAFAIAVAAAAAVLVLLSARVWLREILIYPNDPRRADMLVVVQLGIRRLLRGHNRERWLAAALLCGLLIAGRTTMVSLVPVLLVACGIAIEPAWRERPSP